MGGNRAKMKKKLPEERMPPGQISAIRRRGGRKGAKSGNQPIVVKASLMRAAPWPWGSSAASALPEIPAKPSRA